MSKKPSKKESGMHQEFRRLGVMIEHVDDKVSLVAEQHGDIKKTLHSHSEMIAKILINLGIVKEDVEFIKHGFKKKVDVDEFAALERRVTLLEKHR